MSFLSRLFRKAPSLSAAAASAPRPASSVKADNAALQQSAADRALAAAGDESALQAALNTGDAQALARLVVAGTSTKIRQSAAQAIEDAELLRQLIREVRGGNDKSVYKILTTKRDAQLEQARKLEQLQAEINAASAAIERHGRGAYDASYGPLLDQFETRWEAVAAQADAALRGSVQQWIDRCRETIAEQARQAEAKVALALAAANAAAESHRLHQQQAEAAAALAAEQQQALDEQKRVLTEQQQAEQQALRLIGEMIRKARAALNDGSTARAAGVRRDIEKALAGAAPLPTHMVSQLQQLDQKLDELKDWKSFSVTPKRAELIEAMESLIDSPLDPLALADRIKSVQDEWRTLGKGAGEQVEADQQRFKEAAQKAYQPCSTYFAAQALIRAENLQRREVLLGRLTALGAEPDGQQPDWPAVIKALRETKQEWRNCSPVDRVAAKPQQDAFDAIVANLQGRLDAEYDQNLKQKESLIERAQALLASDDGRKAIDGIKALQQQWRTVGPVPRAADQRLWETFRQHCDAVFQKRQQDAAAYTAGLDHNKAQALALCEQVEKSAAEDAPARLERAALAEWRRAFEALGEFPLTDARELRKRFDQALNRFEQSIARQQARDAERSWGDLFDAGNQVRAYRLAVARGLEMEQIDTLKVAAEACIAAVKQWPKNGLQALQQALASGRSDDFTTNEAALKLLCIRAEMLTDQPTPPEDQALRREYQLQRLVQNMGQGAKADDKHLDAMTIEWVGVGPVEDAAYQPLVQRFRRCREQG